MAQNIESFLPGIQENGLNTAKNAHFYGNLTVDGSTNIATVSLTDLTTTGNTTLGNADADTTSINGVLKILDNGTATATAGAATLAKLSGVITSESLTTAAGATYTLTITDSVIAATDLVFASVALGTATTGTPVVTTVAPAAGSLVIIIQNIHALAALNGTIKVSFLAVKTA